MTRNNFIAALQYHGYEEISSSDFARKFQLVHNTLGLQVTVYTCFNEGFSATYILHDGTSTKLKGKYDDYRLDNNGYPCDA